MNLISMLQRQALFLKIIFLINGIFGYLAGSGQTLTEKLILTDSRDSLLLKQGSVAFDRSGSYCFTVNKNKMSFFINKEDTTGPFNYISSTFGNNGHLENTQGARDQKEEPFYYKNGKGLTVYGTAKGNVESFQTSNTTNNIALVTTTKDSVYYHINGKQVLGEKINPKKYYGLEADWVAFSENGHIMYTVYRDSLFRLFINNQKVDSSRFGFTQMAINNKGEYVYAKGYRPVKPIGKYDYMFHMHTNDTVLGYVRTVWNYELKENGAYYYSGDDNGPSYIAINGKLYKDISGISDILNMNKTNYLFSFRKNGKNQLNVNGRTYGYDFENMIYPTMDTAGHFAFFGLKDYYLYKVINGKKQTAPITKYGVRPTPLYISPTGESLHYFKTDDSIYVYRDEQLVFPPIGKKSGFSIVPNDDFLSSSYIRGKTANVHSLFYLEYDKQAFLVYDGQFSRPLLPLSDRNYSSGDEKPGEIVAGELTDAGFFVIQKTGDKKFLLNVNNKYYQEVEGPDYIQYENCFFDEKELTFYGVKELSFYQFKYRF